MRRGWLVDNESREGAINVIETHDITKDDVKDLVVGRDDGVLQVYGFDMGPAAQQFRATLGESVRSVRCGVAASAGRCIVKTVLLHSKNATDGSE